MFQNVLRARKITENEKGHNYCIENEIVMMGSSGFIGVESLKSTTAVEIVKIEIETSELIGKYEQAIVKRFGKEYCSDKKELRNKAIKNLNSVVKWYVKQYKKYKTNKFDV